MRVSRVLGIAALALQVVARADVRACHCDPALPETMAARECSLCREAEMRPVEEPFFFVRDTNPNKPNRWLVLPRVHGTDPQELAGMTAGQRTAYWTAAIAKARELWGEGWGLAVNNLERRTQCHMHIHIGKVMETAENDRFVVVDTPAQIPLPAENDGLWVHPAGAKLHVHSGDPTPELLLVR